LAGKKNGIWEVMFCQSFRQSPETKIERQKEYREVCE
jgi:hypothetical protein